MGVLISRLEMVMRAAGERWPFHIAPLVGDPRQGTVFLLDGIGGILLAPVNVRKGLQEAGVPFATYVYNWNWGLRGELLVDLIWLRRNRMQGLRLARLLRRFHRENPGAPLHVIAFSGGTGIAVFAAEHLGPRVRIDTLILCCSALSPEYPLANALEHVNRCYAFPSVRDVGFLKLGTTVFGTLDRRFGPAAGLVGFRPTAAGDTPDTLYGGKLRQIWWTDAMRRYGHHGHHVGSATVLFAQHVLAPLLTAPHETSHGKPSPRTASCPPTL